MPLKAAIFTALALGLFTQALQAGDIWQSSVSPSIKLGVRNKVGSGSHQVTFEVKGPYPKPLVLVLKADGDDWAEATFPQDFKATYTVPGKHEWIAKVNGKVVASGDFSYGYRALKQPAR